MALVHLVLGRNRSQSDRYLFEKVCINMNNIRIMICYQQMCLLIRLRGCCCGSGGIVSSSLCIRPQAVPNSVPYETGSLQTSRGPKITTTSFVSRIGGKLTWYLLAICSGQQMRSFNRKLEVAKIMDGRGQGKLSCCVKTARQSALDYVGATIAPG